ncbi:MAG: hypothetical protein RR101_01690 [Burkholderiaceae bacterium]
MFEERPSPAKVTAAAAAKLPRWALIALLVAFIVPGLFGRDPWTLKDAAAFGVMWTMAHGSAIDWWLPNVAGAAAVESGPLTGWVGAVFIRLFGKVMTAPTAARLTIVLWFSLATSMLWYATWRLARRAEAQPVVFAFGGQAQPRDYGRALADVAVLLLVATFGLVVRLHEAVPDTATFALAAAAFFGLVWSLDRPWAGAALTGAAIGGAALSSGLQAAATLLAGALLVTALTPGHRRWRAALTVGVALAVFSIWPLGAWLVAGLAAAPWFDAWWLDNLRDFGPLRGEGYLWFARNFAWYTWPLWPFAAWAIYAWRHSIAHPHMALPLACLAAILLAMPLSASLGDSQMMLLVPPLVVLAAFGASSLRRGAENVIDWFSIAAFSLVATALWLYFFAWQTGWPPKMAHSILRFAPGVAAEINPLYFTVALVATLIWIGLVVWRIRRHPLVLWRGPGLAAAGLAMTWIVVVGLFRDAVDANRDYRPAGREIAAQVANAGGTPGDCVRTWHMPAGVRALIAHHSGLRFERDDDRGQCRFLLHRDMQRSQLDNELPAGSWQLLNTTKSRTRPDEVFRLLTPQP